MNTGLTICFNRVLCINQPPQLNLKALPPTLPLTFFLLLYNQFCQCLKTLKSIQIPLECICSITTSLIVTKCFGLVSSTSSSMTQCFSTFTQVVFLIGTARQGQKVKKISDSFKAAMAASLRALQTILEIKLKLSLDLSQHYHL